MKNHLAFVLLLLGLPGTLQAQILNPPGGPSIDVADRVSQLEAETQTLRAEVQWLREHPVRLPSVDATPTGMALDPLMTEYPDDDYFTLEELRGEMKKLAWKKGNFSVVPYGILWGNTVYATQRTAPGSYTLFVRSASTASEDEFVIDARNTRIGIDVAGPRIRLLGCAPSGGKVEVDFQNSVLSTENRATIMLRHAYAEVKNERFRLLVGQTWDVISPLCPGMLMYSVGWDAGNIGYRRAQVRGERFLAFSDISLLTVQASINQMVFEDGTATIVGETADWPIVEGRVAWTIGQRGRGCRPITIGLSGHVGEEQFDHTILGPNFRRQTWSGNLDLRVPITDRLGVQGEWFVGTNLGAFLGGIGQGINPVSLNAIRSTGGWCEIWYDWTPSLHSHVGYSVDDPNNNDIANGGKIYNQFYYGNLSYDLTKTCLVGVEVSSWKTLYAGDLPGNSVRCEFAVKYGF